MKIRIGGNLCAEGMPRDVAERARRELTVPNPEFVQRERLGKWLGDTKSKLTLFRPGAAALAVGTRKKERIEGIRRIASGKARILFATQLADEGLDAPILDAVILMTPQRSESRTIQRAGRVLRALDDKPQPLVIDLVDNGVGILRHQARSRFFGAYRQLSPEAHMPDWLSDKKRRAA